VINSNDLNYQWLIANFLRPFLRLFLTIRCPFFVAILARKPDNLRIETRVLFDNVRCVIIKYFCLNNFLNNTRPD
tara:strand:- start:653 stop:877 length:225 start_codon:yes stop_codon:yes gene_type:complete